MSGRSIEVFPEGDELFRVTVTEGRGRSEHRVTVTSAHLERYAGSGADPVALLRESFEFLLEREPKESILGSFRLSVIESYFPEFPEEIRKRLR